MKKSPRDRYRIVAAVLAAILLLVLLTVAASAEPDETTTSPDAEPPVVTMEAPIIETTENTTATEPITTEAPTEAPTEPEAETEAPVEPEPTPESETAARSMFRFTPDGSLTLIDDFEYLVDVDGMILSKQFITVQSRDGSYFYIIIDRSGETENVYFLNQVDLADLKALVSGETQTIPETECTCTTTCVPGSINMSCPVCATNMAECAAITAPGKETGKEDEKKDAPTPTEATEPTGNDAPSTQKKTMNPYLALGLIVVVIAGVLIFVFKDKLKGRKGRQLSEYDFDEDEDELETEPAPKEENSAPAEDRQQLSPQVSEASEDEYDDDLEDDPELM